LFEVLILVINFDLRFNLSFHLCLVDLAFICLDCQTPSAVEETLNLFHGYT